ncbi:MAG: NAD-dependent DNA ligase LigA [Akkermansia sp.]
MNLFEFAEQKSQGEQARYEELVALIKRNNELYYAEAQSTISDADYDKLYRELEELEKSHPDWITPDSPTQKVGNDLSQGFAKIQHPAPMQSIDDIFEKKPEEAAETDIELIDFYQGLLRQLGGHAPSLSIEPKIDGCAVTLMYRKGKLAYAATRGDGKRGDDISANMRLVKSIPQVLPAGAPDVLEVRGEVFMRQDAFEALNAARDAAGQPAFANPRNVTAGTIKLLDQAEFASRELDFICHGIGQYEGEELNVTRDFLELLRTMGLPTNEPVLHAQSLEELRAAVAQINIARHELDYGTDGAVIKLDDFALRAQLGSTARAPRWAAAFKFLPEQKETLLRDISIQVGRTGVLTPVAELQEVALSGTMVSRATLHNQDEISRKDICIGDTVLVEKAGEIIPAIVRVIKEKRPAGATPYSIVTAVQGCCPSCGEPISQEEGQVAWRCTNFTCPAQAVMRTMYFARRDCLDIANFGDSVAEALVARAIISSPLDIFELQLEQLSQLNLGTEESPRYLGEKNAAKIIASINKARQHPLERWITAMGIPQVGAETAREFARYHADMEALAQSVYLHDIQLIEEHCQQYNTLKNTTRYEEGAPLRAEMTALAAPWQERGYLSLGLKGSTERSAMELKKSLGDVAIQKLKGYFSSAAGEKFMQKMGELGINPKSESYKENMLEQAGGSLTGLTFVITGSLSQPRPAFKKLIEAAGGKGTGSITGKTTYLLAGEGGGDKRKKAESLNVPIIGEAELNQLLQGQ